MTGRRTAQIVAGTLALITTAACDPLDRAAGPSESEFGMVAFWKVVAADASSTGCTDASDFQDVVKPIEFSPNSYFMYRVSADGTTALSQSCDNVDASTCTDGELEYSVSGHTLTYVADDEIIEAGEGCDLLLQATWTLRDDGETGLFTLSMTFEYDGACDGIEELIKADSGNGLGFEGCEISSTADLALDAID